jgi:macrolide transport system ATP-binding/permease protein
MRVADLLYALRQLRKAPGFTLTAVFTLALGIGALTTVATWTNAVLYNPWPRVADQRSIRFIDATVLGNEGYSLNYQQFQLVKTQSRSFSDGAAFNIGTLNVIAPGGQAQAVMAGTVTANYFRFLGVQPEVGRFFAPDADDRAFGSHDEVVLSDAYWRDRFSADPGLVGRTISINQHAFTVIGVGPKDFAGIFGGIAEAAWVPLSSLRDLSADPGLDPLLHYGLGGVAVRLRPGVSDAVAATEVHTLARRFLLAHGDRDSRWDLNLRDSAHFSRGLFGFVGQVIPVLLAASLLLMALVCINIASLLGQHAARRRREVAIRTALGATPGRIAGQVFTETAILAVAGALAGWAASLAMSRALYVLLPSFGFPLAFNLHTDVRILLFVAAVAMVVTLACGMYPVRQSLRVSQKEALHEGGAAVAGRSRRLPQRILLGVQLSICFVVLACCGLMTRSAINTIMKDPGFNRANTLTAFFDLSRAGYTEARGLAFQAALLDKLRGAPGVAGVTLTSHLPMGDEGSGNTQDLAIPGYVPAKGEDMAVVTDWDGPDFFHTMGISILQGRDFTIHDDASALGAAVINQAMEHRYWPRGDAMGRSVVVAKKSWQIVGIVPNYAYSDPQNLEPAPVLYLPMAQHYDPYTIVAVRSRTTAGALAGVLRRALADLDSGLPLEDVRALEEVSDQRYQLERIPAELLAVYAIASLLVAMMGLYAVTAYSVIERNREFALRMALGSTRAGIFQLVLRGSGMVVGIGLIAGALASVGAVRLVRSMLFGVTAFDPISYGIAALFLLFTVIVSGLAPAGRAASIEPMRALRSE